jgi:DNA replication protein DnaC
MKTNDLVSADLTMIRDHLKQLKLLKMERHLDEVLSWAEKQNQPILPVLNRLLEIEASDLITRRIERRIKESKLPERKLLSDFDFDFQTGIDKKQIMGLATLDFSRRSCVGYKSVRRKQGIILAGNSGTGKSHIAKALLFLGCQQAYRCRYTKASDMLKHLMSGLPDNTLDQKLKTYIQPDILLIDEVGFDRIEQQAAQNASLFFKVIDARYGKSSTWMTTNIGFEAFGDYLGDPVVTTSIVDRMIHHAIIISVNGPSYRIHESKKLNHSSDNEKSNSDDP